MTTPELGVTSAGTVARRDTGRNDGRPVVDVTGLLDEAVGAELWTITSVVLDTRPSGIAVDLSGVTGASEAGLHALSRCLRAARSLPDGVEIVVSSASGRQVLLDTFSTV